MDSVQIETYNSEANKFVKTTLRVGDKLIDFGRTATIVRLEESKTESGRSNTLIWFDLGGFFEAAWLEARLHDTIKHIPKGDA